MTKRKREIIALVILAAFVFAILAVARWYLYAGHGWNVAASHLDDRFGDMDGYVVLLYEGRMHIPIADVDNPEELQKLMDNYKPKSAEAQTGAADNTQTAPFSGNSDTASSDSRSEKVIDAAQDLEEMIEEEVIDINKIATMYREKGAVVFTVRSDRLYDYEEPFIMTKDGHRYGFMLIGPKRHRIGIQLDVAYLRARGADTVIAVDIDPDFDKDSIAGIDAMICVHDCGHNDAGEMIDGAFVTDMPDRGKIEATLVSPSYVFTSKIVG